LKRCYFLWVFGWLNNLTIQTPQFLTDHDVFRLLQIPGFQNHSDKLTMKQYASQLIGCFWICARTWHDDPYANCNCSACLSICRTGCSLYREDKGFLFSNGAKPLCWNPAFCFLRAWFIKCQQHSWNPPVLGGDWGVGQLMRKIIPYTRLVPFCEKLRHNMTMGEISLMGELKNKNWESGLVPAIPRR